MSNWHCDLKAPRVVSEPRWSCHCCNKGNACGTWGPCSATNDHNRGGAGSFTRVGVEAFGFPGCGIEFELLCMGQRLWRQLGLDGIRLELNCIGSSEARASYAAALRDYLQTTRSLV